MRTGRYRFEEHYTQRRWFKPPRPMQVLMVEFEGPIDANMTRGRWWSPADHDDRIAYEARHGRADMKIALLEDERDRLRTRLEGIAEAASRP